MNFCSDLMQLIGIATCLMGATYILLLFVVKAYKDIMIALQDCAHQVAKNGNMKLGPSREQSK